LGLPIACCYALFLVGEQFAVMIEFYRYIISFKLERSSV